MQEQSYEFEMKLSTFAEMALIREFIHKKSNFVLYFVYKFLSILFLLLYLYITDESMLLIFSVFAFFFYEILVLLTFFKVKKIYNSVYKSNPINIVKLRETEIELSNHLTTTIIKWEEITKIKETKWMIRLYKNGVELFLFYKRKTPKNTIDMVLKYVYKQREKYNIKI